MTRTGVVLMTYGSPRDLDDVGAYITRVRGGREPAPDLLEEFRRRYRTIGMSPLIAITPFRFGQNFGSSPAYAARCPPAECPLTKMRFGSPPY